MPNENKQITNNERLSKLSEAVSANAVKPLTNRTKSLEKSLILIWVGERGVVGNFTSMLICP